MALAGCSSGSRCFPHYLVVDRDRFTEIRPDAGTREDGARLGRIVKALRRFRGRGLTGFWKGGGILCGEAVRVLVLMPSWACVVSGYRVSYDKEHLFTSAVLVFNIFSRILFPRWKQRQ